MKPKITGIHHIALKAKGTETFAKLIEFYRTDMTNDDKDVVEFMKTASVKEILQNENLWGEDLSHLESEILKYVNK